MGPKGCRIQHITREHEVQIKFPERDDGAAGENGDCREASASSPHLTQASSRQQLRRPFCMKTARSARRSSSPANVTSSPSPGARRSVSWPKPPCWSVSGFPRASAWLRFVVRPSPCCRSPPGVGPNHGGCGRVVRAASLHHWPERQRDQEDDGRIRGDLSYSAALCWTTLVVQRISLNVEVSDRHSSVDV